MKKQHCVAGKLKQSAFYKQPLPSFIVYVSITVAEDPSSWMAHLSDPG